MATRRVWLRKRVVHFLQDHRGLRDDWKSFTVKHFEAEGVFKMHLGHLTNYIFVAALVLWRVRTYGVAVRLGNSWQIRLVKSGAAVPRSVFNFCCSHGLSYRYQNSDQVL